MTEVVPALKANETVVNSKGNLVNLKNDNIWANSVGQLCNWAFWSGWHELGSAWKYEVESGESPVKDSRILLLKDQRSQIHRGTMMGFYLIMMWDEKPD